jgi:uncharacterized protein (DUF2267 family)
VDQAAALGAQLPMLVRGFYYEGWHPAGTPTKERTKEDFLAHIAAAFRDDPSINAEEVARVVFHVIASHVTPGEVKHVRIALPGEIRSLWSEGMHAFVVLRQLTKRMCGIMTRQRGAICRGK